MRKSRFTEAQIIGMIKEQEAGMPTAEVCRRHGLSTATFYKLKGKYGGMEVSEAARLKALEDENAKLKRLLADWHDRNGHPLADIIAAPGRSSWKSWSLNLPGLCSGRQCRVLFGRLRGSRRPPALHRNAHQETGSRGSALARR